MESQQVRKKCKPAARISSVPSKLVPSLCVCCLKELGEDCKSVPVGRILNIVDEKGKYVEQPQAIPYYTCGRSCSRMLETNKLDKKIGKAVKQLLSKEVDRVLGTRWRCDDQVYVQHNYSPNFRIESGLGTIRQIIYSNDRTSLLVEYAVGGNKVKVVPSGVSPPQAPQTATRSTRPSIFLDSADKNQLTSAFAAVVDAQRSLALDNKRKATAAELEAKKAKEQKTQAIAKSKENRQVAQQCMKENAQIKRRVEGLEAKLDERNVRLKCRIISKEAQQRASSIAQEFERIRKRDAHNRRKQRGLQMRVKELASENVDMTFDLQAMREKLDEVDHIKSQLEETLAQLEAEKESNIEYVEDAERWRSLQLPRFASRKVGGLEYDDKTQELALQLMATGASSVAVQNIWRGVLLSMLEHTGLKEGEDWIVPSQHFLNLKRQHACMVDEMMTGKVLSEAEVYHQVGCDETGLNQTSMQASFFKVNEQQRVHSWNIQASHSGIDTANCVNDTLRRIDNTYGLVKQHLPESGEEAGNIITIGKVASTMNDGTAAALVGADEIAKLALEQRKALFTGTDEEWDALPVEKKTIYKWRCNNHRRVLIAAEYQRAEERLDSEHKTLNENRENNCFHWRMCQVDLASVLRSIGKLVVGKNRSDVYAKGDNELFFAWAEEVKEGETFISMGRLDLGSRFDWVCRGAFGAYHNLEIIADYLDTHLLGEQNILRDSCAVKIASIYVKSKIFCAALVYDKIMEPFNIIINSSELAYAITELAECYDAIYALGECLADGKIDEFLSQDFILFDLAEFEVKKSRGVCTIGGSRVEESKLDLCRSRLYSTVLGDDWKKMKPHVKKHLIAWGESIKISLKRNCSDMLSPDGEYCVAKQTPAMKEVARYCDTTDDANEQTFAVARTYKRRFSSMNICSIMALATTRKNGHLDLPEKPSVYKRQKINPPSSTLLSFHSLPADVKKAHITAAREGLNDWQKTIATQFELYKKHRRDTHANAQAKAIEKSKQNYAVAHELFRKNEWLDTEQKIDRAIAGAASTSAAVAILSAQIKRVPFHGWVDALKTKQPSINLTVGQGVRGIKSQLNALTNTCKQVLRLASELKLTVPSDIPEMSRFEKDLPNICGEITTQRQRSMEKWIELRDQTAQEAQQDDPELESLETKFVNQIFFDDEGDEIRKIQSIHWCEEYGRFMADTKKRAATGRWTQSRPRSDDFYGLSPEELPEMYRMISAYNERSEH